MFARHMGGGEERGGGGRKRRRGRCFVQCILVMIGVFLSLLLPLPRPRATRVQKHEAGRPFCEDAFFFSCEDALYECYLYVYMYTRARTETKSVHLHACVRARARASVHMHTPMCQFMFTCARTRAHSITHAQDDDGKQGS